MDTTTQSPLQRTNAKLHLLGQPRLASRSPATLQALMLQAMRVYLADSLNKDKTMELIDTELLQRPECLQFRALCLELDGDTEHNDAFITRWIQRHIGLQIQQVITGRELSKLTQRKLLKLN